MPHILTIHSHAKAGILNRTMPKQAKNKSLIGVRATFQAANVNAIRCDRVVCVIKAGDLRVKALQICFHRDGSLFISFPYFRNRTGILSSSVIPATGDRQAQVNLENGGKVTSHLVKYSHHTDGRAHFSQDGKVFTAIKRQSIALDTQHGHMFSLLIQGLHALDVADQTKDARTSAKRGVIEFQIDPSSEATKFVGRWFDVSALRFRSPTPTIGPVLTMLDPDGNAIKAVVVANPREGAKHVLAISCVPIPKLGPAPEMFMFYGGFDPAETMTDPSKEAGFLAFLYPLWEADKVRERLGSVDYVPKS